jgi:YidC/Oxa1 family membrane protein insertase
VDTKSLLAILLSIFILIAYQEIISRLYPPPAKKETPPVSTPLPQHPLEEQRAERSQLETPDVQTQTATSGTTRDITVENEVYTAVFSSLGGRLKSLRLKHYPSEEGRDSPPLEMVREGSQGEFPLEVRLEGKGSTVSDSAVVYEVTGTNIQLRGNEQATLELHGKTQNGTLITKRLIFSGQTYGITLEVRAENIPQNISALALLWTHALDLHSNNSYAVHGPVALVGRKLLYEVGSEVAKKEKLLGPDRIRWVGYADTYFLAALIPPEGEKNFLLFQAVNGTVETKISIPWNKEPVIYTVYVGPKEFSALNAVHTSLDRAIDFGWSHFIARPLVYLLKFSHSLSGNYGIDIILLTVLVKLIFFPLSNKSFKSMAEMKQLQPQMERLREEYKDDRERLNRETMELYRRYKINPLSGCLPMLVQLPVFIALYQAFLYAIELRQAPFFGWIQDLSKPDRLGTIALPFIDPPGIPVLTLLMGGTMLVQQAMTPATGDPTQQKMMMLMPVVFTLMFVNFPAGLVLYWLVNNVLSIAQQYAFNKGLI